MIDKENKELELANEESNYIFQSVTIIKIESWAFIVSMIFSPFYLDSVNDETFKTLLIIAGVFSGIFWVLSFLPLFSKRWEMWIPKTKAMIVINIIWANLFVIAAVVAFFLLYMRVYK